MIVMLAGLILTYSRSVWLATLIGITIFFSIKLNKKYRAIIYIVLLLFLLFAIFFQFSATERMRSSINIFTDESIISRFEAWKCSWKIFKDNIFLEQGLIRMR